MEKEQKLELVVFQYNVFSQLVPSRKTTPPEIAPPPVLPRHVFFQNYEVLIEKTL